MKIEGHVVGPVRSNFTGNSYMEREQGNVANGLFMKGEDKRNVTVGSPVGPPITGATLLQALHLKAKLSLATCQKNKSSEMRKVGCLYHQGSLIQQLCHQGFRLQIKSKET